MTAITKDRNDLMKQIVIGMTAHADSGKTTLSEALLYLSGEIRKQGRVDHGDAFLDTHSIERSRGITVFSKQAVIHGDDAVFTLLDTPGHTDFSAEAERALSVVDYAVLVISGTDGVQSHTETLWRLLGKYNKPVFIFVNKMDISQFDRDYILSDLRKHLSDKIADFSVSDDDRNGELALLSESLMNEYLETDALTDESIARDIAERGIFPCWFGSALKLKGARELMTGLEKFTLMPEYGADFGARVYKITSEGGARLTHMKITGGVLRVKDAVGEGKVNQIRIYSGAKFSAVNEAPAGTLCAVTGLADTFAGQGLGAESEADDPVIEPVLTYRVLFPADIYPHDMLDKMRLLEEEDPQLHVVWNEQLGEIHLRLMGKIQLEILRTLIAERFGIDADFDHGSIAYKETISAPAVGIGHYEPLRHYAEVHLLLEPLEQGSGLVFASDCSEDVLGQNWQRLVISLLKATTLTGVLTNSPLTDMKMTLVAGRAHIKHTEGGDFRQATYRALRMGLRSTQSVLLEPFYSFRLEVPSDCAGRAMTDIQRMCGEFSAPEIMGENAVITGTVPVSEAADYHTDVAGYTKGKGRFICELKGYFPCHNSEKVIADIGYDPDSDLEQPADSIFCAHGAGHLVKWNEVKSHAHAQSGVYLAEAADDEIQLSVRETQLVRSRFEDDKELMEIFERTYGKIKRDPIAALHRDYEKAPKYKPSPVPTGPAYLLVDGYNIIFSWDELKKLAEDNLDLARSRLISIMSNYRGFRPCEVIIVFDAYRVKGDHREVEQTGGISVVYTKEAETADMYIEKTSHELAKNSRVRVATSDGAEQIIILGNGAYRVTASELHDEVAAVEKAIREMIAERPMAQRNIGSIKVKE